MCKKITIIKIGVHKKITFCSLKHYTANGNGKAWSEVKFPNFANVNDVYSDFLQKLMEVIDKVAPVKNKRIKTSFQEWFDFEISEKLMIRDKLFKKYKKSGFM